MNNKNLELIYLACPYGSDDPDVILNRVSLVNHVAGILMGEYYVFSPVSHLHPITISANLPTTWEYWNGYCKVMLKMCDKLFVLMLDGWNKSVGVKGEIDAAKELGIPIVYIKYDENKLPKIQYFAYGT